MTSAAVPPSVASWAGFAQAAAVRCGLGRRARPSRGRATGAGPPRLRSDDLPLGLPGLSEADQ
eukprot:704062-Pyramimonas_sp.AAC.1